jgi:hypothetical protein
MRQSRETLAPPTQAPDLASPANHRRPRGGGQTGTKPPKRGRGWGRPALPSLSPERGRQQAVVPPSPGEAAAPTSPGGTGRKTHPPPTGARQPPPPNGPKRLGRRRRRTTRMALVADAAQPGEETAPSSQLPRSPGPAIESRAQRQRAAAATPASGAARPANLAEPARAYRSGGKGEARRRLPRRPHG